MSATSPLCCPHTSPEMARRFPAAPCQQCGAFVDADGTLMTAEVARARYPQHAAQIDVQQQIWAPPRPSAVATIGQLATTLLKVVFALAALGILVALIAALAHG